MTNITLHGEIAEQVGRENWTLKISSIKEALRAIQVLSKGKLLKYLIGAAEKSVEYKVLVNKREILSAEEISLEKPESIFNSELVMINEKLETLDIVPIIKGAGGGGNSSTKGVLALVLGVLLIATGVGAPAALGFVAGSTTSATVAGALIGAGIGLAVTGVTLLMMSPPKFDDFRKIQDGGKPNYLFDGPSNILGEGGPVPVGYGTMKIGSQTVEISLNNVELDVKSTAKDVKNEIYNI